MSTSAQGTTRVILAMACRRAVGLGLVVCGVAPTVASGQEGTGPPQTEWGAPDLRGIWDFRTMTPLATAALSNLAAKSPVAFKHVEKWTKSKNEWVGGTGWHTLASLAREDEGVSDSVLDGYLKRIEAEIHGAKNYTRYAMNNALISIGIRNPKIRKKAVAAAKRIGKVEVDHGQTSCKTPDAVPYIANATAHQAKMAQKKKVAKRKTKKKATAGAR